MEKRANGRPRLAKNVIRIGFCIDANDRKALLKICKREKITMAVLMRHLCESYLEYERGA